MSSGSAANATSKQHKGGTIRHVTKRIVAPVAATSLVKCTPSSDNLEPHRPPSITNSTVHAKQRNPIRPQSIDRHTLIGIPLVSNTAYEHNYSLRAHEQSSLRPMAWRQMLLSVVFPAHDSVAQSLDALYRPLENMLEQTVNAKNDKHACSSSTKRSIRGRSHSTRKGNQVTTRLKHRSSTSSTRGRSTLSTRGRSTLSTRGRSTLSTRSRSTSSTRGRSTSSTRGRSTSSTRGRSTSSTRGRSTSSSRKSSDHPCSSTTPKPVPTHDSAPYVSEPHVNDTEVTTTWMSKNAFMRLYTTVQQTLSGVNATSIALQTSLVDVFNKFAQQYISPPVPMLGPRDEPSRIIADIIVWTLEKHRKIAIAATVDYGKRGLVTHVAAIAVTFNLLFVLATHQWDCTSRRFESCREMFVDEFSDFALECYDKMWKAHVKRIFKVKAK